MSQDTFTLTNGCTCATVDENGDEVSSLDCFGCFDESVEAFGEFMEARVSGLRIDDEPVSALIIRASGVNWTRNSYIYTLDVDSDYFEAVGPHLVESLSINTEWRITATETDLGKMSVVRYSHDEPTGASFDIEMVNATQFAKFEAEHLVVE